MVPFSVVHACSDINGHCMQTLPFWVRPGCLHRSESLTLGYTLFNKVGDRLGTTFTIGPFSNSVENSLLSH